MADVAEDLIAEIITAASTLGNRVHQNRVPQHQRNTFPRAYVSRTGQDNPLDLGGGAGIETTFFTVETISDDQSQSLAVSLAIESTLHGIGSSTTFGNGKAQRVMVDDVDDDYLPKGVASDDGLFVETKAVRVVGHTT